jgi:DNA mismatch repair protein MutS2
MNCRITEKTLGFDIIRDRLILFATSEKGKKYLYEMELSSELPVILSSLDLVTEMKRLISESEFPIHGIMDIEKALDGLRAPEQMADPKDLFNIAATMTVSRRVFGYVFSKKEVYPGLYEICSELEIFEDIEENILKSIDSEGYVLDTASKELRNIRSAIQVTQNRLRKKTADIFEAYTHAGYTREGEITMRDGRFVIPVRADKRNKVSGIVIDESATGNTVFIEPYEAVEINSEMEKLIRQERKEIERIIRALSTEVFNIRNELLANLEILAETDTIFAKARFSVKYHCHHTRINNKNIINVYYGRHPLLLDSHGEKGVVPLDIEIGEKYNTLIITGPNAGGKTVTLKTVGLFCMMAKAGMHIPAQSNSNIGIFSEIFTDIGDGQSIESDLSTFSSHVTKISSVLKSKAKDTLVLFDEIGASTDPAEGASLSMSVLTELSKRKFITLATTHQGILKSFAYKTAGVENGSMEFDKANITPTYKFRAGIPGSSYAFEISKRHGLPQYIIDNARKYMSSEKEDLEGLISELDEKITTHNNLLRQSKNVNQQLTELKEAYNKKYDEITKNEKKILREAAKKAQDIIANSNKAIENAVAGIKSANADKNVVKEAKAAIETEKKKIDSIAREPEKKKEPFKGDLKPGMEVRLNGFSTTGIIEGISGNNVEVTVGSLKLRVKKSEVLEVVEREENVSVNIKFSPSEDNAVSLRLDLRGKRGDEAVALVERHIENMILNNINYSEIVHGKGQGILSRMVNEYLERCPYIKNKKFGEYGEGDYGVTVIELK